MRLYWDESRQGREAGQARAQGLAWEWWWCLRCLEREDGELVATLPRTLSQNHAEDVLLR